MNVRLAAHNAKNALKYPLSQVFSPVPKRSETPLEVLLVTAPKDYDTLGPCLESIQRFLKHPITKISIVSKESEAIKEFCDAQDCVFIDERSILGYGLERFETLDEANLKGREGWFFQQLLKLGFDEFCEQEQYVVVDADTIFLKPRIFTYGDQVMFDTGDSVHLPYRTAYRRLMGFEATAHKSLVAHCMLFEKTVLRELKNHIEAQHNVSWDDAILATADYSSASFFSEYETYGNFFLRCHKNRMKQTYWFNYVCTDFLRTKHPFWARSLSSHAYLRSEAD